MVVVPTARHLILGEHRAETKASMEQRSPAVEAWLSQ
jgi:hypothetical protein